MSKFGNIEFDDRILDAIRDERLVVFAGAGVSQGPPSNLDGFERLACKIAKGYGPDPIKGEPLDRFLGQLQHRNVDVHKRAARLITPEGSIPNAMHHDLLRLFQNEERVRLVTTNFDLHFEAAYKNIFNRDPEVYCAPALPLGHNFTGIVHVHGAIPKAKDFVLTDSDFGRAYLTEGWARRFLVDLFQKFTVMFVGYSHGDVVMTYLARALPPNDSPGRFVLTDLDGEWDLLGIKPIRFIKSDGPDGFKALYEGIHLLAERTSRGALDWQSRLAELASRKPPTDPESISEIEQALREVYTTRFLLDVARDPEWIRWLDVRKLFGALFTNIELNERDKLFVAWLAQHFTIDHPHEVLKVVAAHGLTMNPQLWWAIGREIGSANEKSMDESGLKRLAGVMIACAPAQADEHVLMCLAERCAKQGLVELALRVFMVMSQHRLNVRSGYAPPDVGDNESLPLVADCSIHTDHWSMNEVWKKLLKPQIANIAQPILTGVTRRLEEMFNDLSAWDRVSPEWDPLRSKPLAVESDVEGSHPEPIDVLIDAARDALEWLAANSPKLLESWIERLVSSEVALLRRLAIHAMTVNSERLPEARLQWVLDRVGLYAPSEHYEIYRSVAENYPKAPEWTRKAVVDSILAHKLPSHAADSTEMRTARSQHEWLSWLLRASPDCELASAALATITAKYPDWKQTDNSDHTRWMGKVCWVVAESPWTVSQLLGRKPEEQFEDLLSFKGDRFEGPSREGLLETIRDACKQNSIWAFSLSKTLSERALWSSDLWPAVIRGLQESEQTLEDWSDLLDVVSNPNLQSEFAHEIANLLYGLVKDGGKPYSLELIEQANPVALTLWQDLKDEAQDQEINDWLTRAINRPAGVIVEFWINSLSLLLHKKSGSERMMPQSYRDWFTMVVRDETTNGGMGRCVLASQTAFLFSVDEAWTRQHIIPLFTDPDDARFAQAWDGFLVWGRLNPALADVMIAAFVHAIPRLRLNKKERRRVFIEYFTELAMFLVKDPTIELLPDLIKNGLKEDRLAFAARIGFRLRHMQPESRIQLWNDWLKRYWEDRLDGVPDILVDSEIQMMLNWLPHLGDAYPQAVRLAIRRQLSRLEHCHMLYELQNSELVTQYPNETADLLIYLSKCDFGAHASYMLKVESRLPELPADLGIQLNEAFARAGLRRTLD